jgi:hypothetical protein
MPDCYYCDNCGFLTDWRMAVLPCSDCGYLKN